MYDGFNDVADTLVGQNDREVEHNTNENDTGKTRFRVSQILRTKVKFNLVLTKIIGGTLV